MVAWGELKDPKTTAVMNSVLDNEHSDLVVLNGDLISCENVAPNEFNGVIDQIVAPFVSRNLPFAATCGNHDYSETCSTCSMASHMWWDTKGINGDKPSITMQSVDGQVEEFGWSNQYVPAYSFTDSNRLEILLWFFDSKGGKIFQPGANLDTPIGRLLVPVDEGRFQYQNARIIPSLVFVHTPAQATRPFQKSGRLSKMANPGLNTEMIGHKDDRDGPDCYNHRDYSFMKALVETERLILVVSGHDHGVDWCMKWDKDLQTSPTNGNGVSFCFNRHMGFGGYSNWKRGARNTENNEDKLREHEVDTQIRLEDGSNSGRVT